MITIAQAVEEIFTKDDVAVAAARKGWLNLSAYARSIQPLVQAALMKEVEVGSLITALSRAVSLLSKPDTTMEGRIQSLAVHPGLDGLTYERSEAASARIRELYTRTPPDNKAFLTVTQGINEITILAEAAVARHFREALSDLPKVYDKRNLTGITIKFPLGNLEVPNLIHMFTRRLAYKDVNIIEVVSTATELTYIIEKKDAALALEQLQKDM